MAFSNMLEILKEKEKVSIEQISEIGKIVGGLIKYYGKNNKKWVWQKAILWKFN